MVSLLLPTTAPDDGPVFLVVFFVAIIVVVVVVAFDETLTPREVEEEGWLSAIPDEVLVALVPWSWRDDGTLL